MQNNTLPFNTLTAITPLDGRYRDKIEELANQTSEFSLIKTRIEVEAKYLIALSKTGICRKMLDDEEKLLNGLINNLSIDDAQKVKDLEKETRHDVKAMERTFRSKLEGTSLEDLIEMIHFGITSEDINNLALRLIITRASNQICLKEIKNLLNDLLEKAQNYKETPMLGRTHGQPAIPTTVGKELVNFASRLNDQIVKLEGFKFYGKLGGAIGNLNALTLAFPQVDWIKFSEDFVFSFGFRPNLTTTQINPYDDIVEYFQTYQRINTILIDLDQDIWRYISDNWFIQEVKKGEVGSSTMPQKVNPIDFENSEGNLGMANSIIEFFARKLPVSRLQRDLSDSTVVRNVGTCFGFSLIGYKSLLTGLSRIKPDTEKIAKDLEKDYAVLTEAAQTILRKKGVKDPYSLVASLSRGEHIEKSNWQEWIQKLPLEKEDKVVLENLTPISYIGLAVKLTEKAIEKIKLNK
ncbi:adenylosuccinate lyase [Candidatus Microgenomates bacterium]|nr:MAG: adenylosuccinate lyase [Candidatus Microgenomates bacterium]